MAVTTNSGIIKMPEAGDTLTMHVTRCEVVEGKFGEQIKFTNTRGDALFVGRETADRQLSRIGFADGELVIYGDVDGQTLVFSRDPNPKGKPYWSISRVVHEDVTHRPSLAEQAKEEAERIRKAKGLPPDPEANIGKLPFDDAPPPTDADNPYSEDDGMPPVRGQGAVEYAGISDKESNINKAYERAWQVAVAVQGQHGSPEAIQAGAATLLIKYGQAGIC